MKRGAEKQLSKDDREDEDGDDIQEVAPPGGISKADEATLATRKIKGLPKRLAGISPEPSSAPSTNGGPPPPDAKPKFSGFSGFGATALASSSASIKPATSAFTFGAAGSTPSTSPFSAPAPAPVASSASNATKAFASFISPSSAPSPPLNGTNNTSTSNGTASASAAPDPAALKYYTSLRGLNASLVSSLTRAVDADPFSDLGALLEQYRAHRVSVQSEFDAAPQPAPAPAPTQQPPTPVVAPSAMPTPPSSFSGFSLKPSASTGSVSGNGAGAAGGFTPSLAGGGTKPSGFSFPPPSSSAHTPFAAPASSFAFGSQPAKKDAPAPAADARGADKERSGAAKETEMEKESGTGTGTGAAKEPAAKASAPTFAGFGSTFATPRTSTLFGGAPAGEDKKLDATSKSGFSFGAAPTSAPAPSPFFGSTSSGASPFSFAPTPPSSSSSLTADKDKAADKDKDKDEDAADKDKPAPAPGFSFGAASSSPPKGGFFPFGAAAAKTGEASPPAARTPPVGFSFGAPPPAKLDLGAGGTSGTSGLFGSGSGSGAFGSGSGSGSGSAFGSGSGTFGSGGAFGSTGSFTFGSSGAFGAGVSTPAGADTGTPTSEDTPAPAPADVPSAFGAGGAFDREGEGEEDEETTHEVRGKVYRLSKDSEGKSSWSDLGIGMLRLKRHKETDKRRVFLRNSSTGKIVLNFNVYAALAPSQSKNVISFVGHDGGGAQGVAYRVRTRTEESATALRDALAREIEFVKGSTE